MFKVYNVAWNACRGQKRPTSTMKKYRADNILNINHAKLIRLMGFLFGINLAHVEQRKATK